MDLYSRAVVGWSMSAQCDEELVERALDMAVTRRQPKAELLHHSDRGCQYTSRAYRQRLKQVEMIVSMSRKGNCWDNAAMESFFGSRDAKNAWETYSTLPMSTPNYRFLSISKFTIIGNDDIRHSDT